MLMCFAKRSSVKNLIYSGQELFSYYTDVSPCHLAIIHFYDTVHLASHLANTLVSASVNLSFGQKTFL
jgi:hypothetical protein